MVKIFGLTVMFSAPTPRLLLGFALFGLAWTSGCVDTSAVATFAKTATVAEEKFPSIANDYHGSCVRRQEFVVRGTVLFGVPEDPDNQLTQAERDKFLDYLKPLKIGGDNLIALNPVVINTRAESECSAASKVGPELTKINQVLVAYITALGKLAGDSAVKTDTQVGALADSVKSAGLLTDVQTKALKSLAQFALDVALNTYRDRELSKAIGKQNDNLQIVVAGLRSLTGEPYDELFTSEGNEMDSYYGKLAKYQDPSPSQRHQLYKEWQKAQEDLVARRRAVRAYRAILLTISQGHQELYMCRKSLSDEQVKDIISKYGAQLSPLIKQVNEAF